MTRWLFQKLVVDTTSDIYDFITPYNLIDEFTIIIAFRSLWKINTRDIRLRLSKLSKWLPFPTSIGHLEDILESVCTVNPFLFPEVSSKLVHFMTMFVMVILSLFSVLCFGDIDWLLIFSGFIHSCHLSFLFRSRAYNYLKTFLLPLQF